MSYFLVTFVANYADEFDCEKLWLMPGAVKDAFFQKLEESIDGPSEHYFGSNESIDFDTKEQLLECFEVTELDVRTYTVMKALLDPNDWGFGTGPSFEFDEEDDDLE